MDNLDKQELVMKKIRKRPKEGGSRKLFITGSAGTGKTWLIKRIVEWARTKKLKIAVTAATGSAAKLIGGTTLHAWSGYDAKKTDAYNLYKMGKRKLEDYRVLIIDEISMVTDEHLDLIDQTLRDAKDSEERFGDLIVIVLGDFYQLPPVKGDWAFMASCWDCFETITLDRVYRQTDPVFTSILEKIRVGSITNDVKKILRSRIGINLEYQAIEPTRLYSHRIDVSKFNNEHLENLSGIMKYEAKDIKEKVDSILEKDLRIANGAQVMLIKNLDFAKGLINGSRGVVIDHTPSMITVRFKDYIETITPVELNGRYQFPLKLAWALTIHKSQGMSLDSMVVDLTEVFEDHQVYVALSRARSLESLSIEKEFSSSVITINPQVREFYSGP